MSTGMLLLKQIGIMFILMCIGLILYKKKLITDQGSKDIGKLLLYLVIPVVIVSNFCIERTPEKTQALMHSALISFVCMMVAIMISYVFFGKSDGISNFSSSFSNAGFIGIPLVQAVLGSGAVINISIMIVLVNALQWTYGVFIISGDKSVMSARRIITNPIVIAVAIGLIIYFSGFTMPEIAASTFSIISGLNTPLAMIVSGVYLAQSDLKAMIAKKNTYLVSLVRLVIIPLITITIFRFLPFGTQEIKLAIMIAAACPVGSNVAIFAQAYNRDYTKAVEQVCMSTILCLLTLPIMITLAEQIL